MMRDAKLDALEKGDTIVGGTMLEALDQSEISWEVTKDSREGRFGDVTFKVTWLGVDLGTHRISTSGKMV